MKAKTIVSVKTEQPDALPTPSGRERRDQLAPWQKEIVALAKARLSVSDEQSVISDMLRRAIGLAETVEDLALGKHESEISLSSLARVMQTIQEDIYVAKWIAGGRPLYEEWF